MAISMTRGQAHCLEIVKRYLTECGYSPSFDELRMELGLKSKSGVHRLVHGLVERGQLFYLPNRKRSLSLTPPEEMVMRARCPHCGQDVFTHPKLEAA